MTSSNLINKYPPGELAVFSTKPGIDELNTKEISPVSWTDVFRTTRFLRTKILINAIRWSKAGWRFLAERHLPWRSTFSHRLYAQAAASISTQGSWNLAVFMFVKGTVRLARCGPTGNVKARVL